MWHRPFLFGFILAVFLVTTGCTVPQTLIPALPEEEDELQIVSSVRQPFLSQSDGLHRLMIRFFPEGFPGSQLPVDPAQGATVRIDYDPAADPRFPEPDFHSWPSSHSWLPELTGDRSFGQVFSTPYPRLNGITLRVANFGADMEGGPATIQSGGDVQVRSLPDDGEVIGTLPGGSTVETIGTGEGWVRIEASDGLTGFVRFEDLDQFNDPIRINDRDVILELFEADSSESPLRRSVINASDMFDNSHVTFPFDTVDDAVGRDFMFVVTSPESVQGNAVAFRYSPDDIYSDGQIYTDSQRAEGDFIFSPEFEFGSPLFEGQLSDFEWAAPYDAFEISFDPISNTGDRYLAITINARDRPITVPWSRNRPPGDRPLSVEDASDTPEGGLLFNATYRDQFPIGNILSAFSSAVLDLIRRDISFSLFYAMTIVLVSVLGVVGSRRRHQDGS